MKNQAGVTGQSSRVVIAGGSGFLGMNLARWLTVRGHQVTILSRSNPPTGPWRFCAWDARSLGEWAESIDGCDAIVNLAGRTVDCIKNALHKDQILRSRVESTEVLGHAVRAAKQPPKVWVQMSTAHIYGDSELPCDESSAFGYGLAPDVGRAWEDAYNKACPEGVRRAVVRTSFVLGKSGGALPKLARLARLGLGGTIGSGKQGMSWIHETDMNRIFERVILDDSMPEMCIASSPEPASNKAFMKALRRAVGMPIGPPAFEWMIRLGAPLLLRTDPELALYGRYVFPKRLIDGGFTFEQPDLERALADLLGK
ncbi:MAG: TIGR01777 family oxidoreductase [Phycisphaerales bacterium]